MRRHNPGFRDHILENEAAAWLKAEAELAQSLLDARQPDAIQIGSSRANRLALSGVRNIRRHPPLEVGNRRHESGLGRRLCRRAQRLQFPAHFVQPFADAADLLHLLQTQTPGGQQHFPRVVQQENISGDLVRSRIERERRRPRPIGAHRTQAAFSAKLPRGLAASRVRRIPASRASARPAFG